MTVATPSVRLLMVGDLILDEPDPDFYLAPSTEVLRAGDVVVGQVEVPHSHRGMMLSSDVPATPADPAHLAALSRAGFGIATLAGNHIFDAGPEPIEDTIATLTGLGIATTGAGATLEQARQPATATANGVSVTVHDYNCVGPKESWARASKAGCAFVNVLTHYELDHASPGGPPTIYTFAAPESLDAMRADLAASRPSADVLVVALHKGIGHLRSTVAAYEREVARAAIDAGADVVIGHHAHIMRGIEFHRGRPIFHGLGNFVTVTHALSPTDNDSPEAEAWARRRVELFGFAPDPAMPIYPFHPESRNTIIADCRVGPGGAIDAGFVPCWIDDEARPIPLTPGPQADSVIDYVVQIGREAGLDPIACQWDGDRVRVRDGG
jgi:hypothetical protein